MKKKCYLPLIITAFLFNCPLIFAASSQNKLFEQTSIEGDRFSYDEITTTLAMDTTGKAYLLSIKTTHSYCSEYDPGQFTCSKQVPKISQSIFSLCSLWRENLLYQKGANNGFTGATVNIFCSKPQDRLSKPTFSISFDEKVKPDYFIAGILPTFIAPELFQNFSYLFCRDPKDNHGIALSALSQNAISSPLSASQNDVRAYLAEEAQFDQDKSNPNYWYKSNILNKSLWDTCDLTLDQFSKTVAIKCSNKSNKNTTSNHFPVATCQFRKFQDQWAPTSPVKSGTLPFAVKNMMRIATINTNPSITGVEINFDFNFDTSAYKGRTAGCFGLKEAGKTDFIKKLSGPVEFLPPLTGLEMYDLLKQRVKNPQEFADELKTLENILSPLSFYGCWAQEDKPFGQDKYFYYQSFDEAISLMLHTWWAE